MTPNSLIKSSLRAIGAIATGETPSAAEMADGLEALNMLLKLLSAKPSTMVYAITKDSFALAAGTASYTWGTTGTWNTARPARVQGAFVRDANGSDHHVGLIGEGQYRGFSLKSNSARPDKLFYNPAYPNGTAYVYPTPAAVETIHLDSLKPLTTFTSLIATIELPGEYEELLKWNLAVRLAPEYGKSPGVEVAAFAAGALDTVRTLNAAMRVEEIFAEPAVARGGSRYDINQG